MKLVPDKAITHVGRFHADDVFSAALLKILNPNIEIIRKNEVPNDFDGLAFDIGRGQYDHHQNDLIKRDNGIPYASFGLLWREYGEMVMDKESAIKFDENFVQPLDLHDNNGGINPLARVITQWNPQWNSNVDPDENFVKAVNIALSILNNEFLCIESANAAKSIVLKALKNSFNGIVVLPIGVPWKSVLIPENVEFVVYPSKRGGYNAQAIPIDFESLEVKCAFPKCWRGLENTALAEVSGIDGLEFCHKNGYLITTQKRIGAINACEKAKMDFIKYDKRKGGAFFDKQIKKC